MYTVNVLCIPPLYQYDAMHEIVRIVWFHLNFAISVILHGINDMSKLKWSSKSSSLIMNVVRCFGFLL